MKISVIASGSNGNSTLVENKDTTILIDAGKSGKEIELRLKKMGKSLENLNAILLTHSHSDHAQSVGVLARKYNVSAYMQSATKYELGDKLGTLDIKTFKHEFKINNLSIKPIPTMHDVVSTGFVIDKFGIFTDTGIVTKQMENTIPKLKSILLESNHDVDLLLQGPYPYYLKQRIMSESGHLNNFDAANFIQSHGKHLDMVLLGHLSGTNTTQELTKSTYESIVKHKINYQVLDRKKESGTWDV